MSVGSRSWRGLVYQNVSAPLPYIDERSRDKLQPSLVLTPSSYHVRHCGLVAPDLVVGHHCSCLFAF